MNIVTIRGVELGAGKPKIAASITGATAEEILAQARVLTSLPVDIAEWRMDWFGQAEDPAAVEQALCALRAALGEMPLLATFRTKGEGGQRALAAADYEALCRCVIAADQADLMDVELFSGEETVSRLITAAHSAGMPVLLSNHDFEKTPPKAELIRRLCQMQALGADILKLAVMPRTRRDVLTLLEATEEMYTCHAQRPLVTMSMGDLGAITRLGGGVFGSAMTFGAACAASAPGQINAAALAQALSLLPALS